MRVTVSRPEAAETARPSIRGPRGAQEREKLSLFTGAGGTTGSGRGHQDPTTLISVFGVWGRDAVLLLVHTHIPAYRDAVMICFDGFDRVVEMMV